MQALVATLFSLALVCVAIAGLLAYFRVAAQNADNARLWREYRATVVGVGYIPSTARLEVFSDCLSVQRVIE